MNVMRLSHDGKPAMSVLKKSILFGMLYSGGSHSHAPPPRSRLRRRCADESKDAGMYNCRLLPPRSE
eukprot:scaffold5329_cov85-Skeletonema_menzelii.AAC.5